jgi:hypothetical protein
MQAQNVSAHYYQTLGDLTSLLEGGLQGGPYAAPSNFAGVIVALRWVSDRVGLMSLGKRVMFRLRIHRRIVFRIGLL